MGKSLEISDMPPLTREMQSDLRLVEHRLKSALSSCCDGYDLIDPHAAFEYTRTYATEFYDCFYSFYSQIPDTKYRPHWRPASEKFAFQRVAHCIENHYAIRSYFKSDTQRVARIKRTISDYADRTGSPPLYPPLPPEVLDQMVEPAEDKIRQAGSQVAEKEPASENPVQQTWDVFMSHASKDKPYVGPLVDELVKAGVTVWYDKHVLGWGDPLRPSINKGLINSRYAIVVLSKAFLAERKWTEHELNGLFAREEVGNLIILPIWHGIEHEDLVSYDPGLADRLAKISKTDSYPDIVKSVLKKLGRAHPAPARRQSAGDVDLIFD